MFQKERIKILESICPSSSKKKQPKNRNMHVRPAVKGKPQENCNLNITIAVLPPKFTRFN